MARYTEVDLQLQVLAAELAVHERCGEPMPAIQVDSWRFGSASCSTADMAPPIANEFVPRSTRCSPGCGPEHRSTRSRVKYVAGCDGLDTTLRRPSHAAHVDANWAGRVNAARYRRLSYGSAGDARSTPRSRGPAIQRCERQP